MSKIFLKIAIINLSKYLKYEYRVNVNQFRIVDGN
ncbi:hypothetical protein B6N60_03639 [Richelia sinica FACHB-800]|uniref:Uncharacterized protein n=1 Tax=Richelia sinica FACHB-800 TaxID=1357546 RepID=A0A975Y662_9NOST|nr:hypothetical protein B6N60_03639 [Richelia sinica FACHB-800]